MGRWQRVLVVASSWLARILGDCLTIHSPPALFVVVVVVYEVEISSRILIPIFYARISQQWLSELRRLWLSVT